MQSILIVDLYPGMVTAEDIFVPGTSQIIIQKGITLTDKIISRLEFHSVFSIRIEDTEKDAIPEMEETFSQRVRSSKQFQEFSRKYDEDISVLEDSLNDVIKQNKPLDPELLLTDMLRLLHTTTGRINVFDMLTNLRVYDDHTYAHAINVALISNVFAGWLRFSQEDIRIATLCGLLHDIGKLMIPEEILKKPTSLTSDEFKIIKTHPREGYRKLIECGIDPRICDAALMHHERYDGSGYPQGLQGEQISPFASLVSLADVYDAMTAARVYRGPICPFRVVSLMEADGYQKYAPKYLLTFLENIVNTYLLHNVLLSDGTEGTLIYINKDKLSCPTIKVGNEYIDLSKRPDLSIVKII